MARQFFVGGNFKMCVAISIEYRMSELTELTNVQEWYYQVHQRHPGELEQRKARPQDW
jgi:hypothetical protein